MRPRLSVADYTIALFLDDSLSQYGGRNLLEHIHAQPYELSDDGPEIHYSWGTIGEHNVTVIALLGDTSAERAMVNSRKLLPNLWAALFLGTCIVVPQPYLIDTVQEIRPGQVVVSLPREDSAGAFAYDLIQPLVADNATVAQVQVSSQLARAVKELRSASSSSTGQRQDHSYIVHKLAQIGVLSKSAASDFSVDATLYKPLRPRCVAMGAAELLLSNPCIMICDVDTLSRNMSTTAQSCKSRPAVFACARDLLCMIRRAPKVAVPLKRAAEHLFAVRSQDDKSLATSIVADCEELRSTRSESSLMIHMDWNFVAFLRQERIATLMSLRNRLTLSGTPTKAVAKPCGRYIFDRWGDNGLRLFYRIALIELPRLDYNDIDDAVNSGSLGGDELSLLRSIAARNQPWARSDVLVSFREDGLCVLSPSSRVTSTELQLICEVVSWMAATFRVSYAGYLQISQMMLHRRHVKDHTHMQYDVWHKSTPVNVQEVSASASCWHVLFPYTFLALSHITETWEAGLQLPFDMMIDLTGMLYRIDLASIKGHSSVQDPDCESDDNTDDDSTPASGDVDSRPAEAPREGIFYCGVKRMLYPVSRSEHYVRWHFDTASGSPAPEGRWLRCASAAELQDSMVLLGFATSAGINLGTLERSKDGFASTKNTSAMPGKRALQIGAETITLQTGISGMVNLNISAAIKASYSVGLRHYVEDQTYLEMVREACKAPVILYETSPGLEMGWLVLQINVILDLVLQECCRNGWKVPPQLFAHPSRSDSHSMEVIFLQNGVDLELGRRRGEQTAVSFVPLVQSIWSAMNGRERIEEMHNDTRPPLRIPGASRALQGWDLLELIDRPACSRQRHFKVHKTSLPWSLSPTWLPLATELPVYFCDGLGQLIVDTREGRRRIAPSQRLLVASSRALSMRHRYTPDCRCVHLVVKNTELVWEFRQSSVGIQHALQDLLPLDQHQCTQESPCSSNPLFPYGAAKFEIPLTTMSMITDELDLFNRLRLVKNAQND